MQEDTAWLYQDIPVVDESRDKNPSWFLFTVGPYAWTKVYIRAGSVEEGLEHLGDWLYENHPDELVWTDDMDEPDLRIFMHTSYKPPEDAEGHMPGIMEWNVTDIDGDTAEELDELVEEWREAG